jgi:hypothetical protein
MPAKLALSIVLLFCASCATPSPTPAPTAQSSPSPSTIAKTIGLKDYEAIETGVTLAEVEKMLGEGESVMSNDFNGVKTESVMWKNADFSNMVLTFQDGKLVSKTQTNLK